MTLDLDFPEDQLCELWMQHTSLEDDPRDARVRLSSAVAWSQWARVA